MAYFLALTFLALGIGLAVVNIIHPGEGVNLAGTAQYNNTDTSTISLKDELNKIFQPSFFQAAVGFNPHTGKPSNNGGEILAIVFMAVIFSLAIMKTKHVAAKATMIAFNRSLSEIMFVVVNMIMYFAPFGIYSLTQVYLAPWPLQSVILVSVFSDPSANSLGASTLPFLFSS